MYITPLKHPVPLLFKEITSAGVSLERTVMICSIIGITRSLFCLIPQLKIYIQHLRSAPIQAEAEKLGGQVVAHLSLTKEIRGCISTQNYNWHFHY